MFRIRMAWLAGVVTASLLAVMLLSVGGAAAKTPGWQFIDGFTNTPITQPCLLNVCQPSFTGSPTTVGPGAYVAFDVAIKNTGTSNISALYLTTDIPTSNPMGNPVYIFDAVWTDQFGTVQPTAPARPCVPFLSAPLFCSFGALNAGWTVTVEIVFQAPTTAGSQAFNFLANGNGNTPSDGGTSHGDTLKGPASFTVSSSKDFAGGFVINSGTTFSTDPTLSKKNPQSSSVTSPTTLIPITLQEGSTYPGTGTDPCTATGVTCIGQWADLHLNNGQSYPGGIRVVLTILGSTVPGSVSLDQIDLYHDGDGTITTRCDSATSPSVIPCIIVSKVGNNIQILAWLLHNGGLHGTY